MVMIIINEYLLQHPQVNDNLKCSYLFILKNHGVRKLIETVFNSERMYNPFANVFQMGQGQPQRQTFWSSLKSSLVSAFKK